MNNRYDIYQGTGVTYDLNSTTSFRIQKLEKTTMSQSMFL